jgi:hypothetical protein
MVSEPAGSLGGEKGEFEMKLRLSSCKRAVASSMALAALFVVSAGQAPAAEPMRELKSKEVRALVASAKTPADHMKLARHYTAMAVKHDAEAQEHEVLAAEYTKNAQLGASKHPMAPNTAEHCKFYAEHCRNAAKEMRAMAAAHEEMAKSLTN